MGLARSCRPNPAERRSPRADDGNPAPPSSRASRASPWRPTSALPTSSRRRPVDRAAARARHLDRRAPRPRPRRRLRRQPEVREDGHDHLALGDVNDARPAPAIRAGPARTVTPAWTLKTDASATHVPLPAARKRSSSRASGTATPSPARRKEVLSNRDSCMHASSGESSGASFERSSSAARREGLGGALLFNASRVRTEMP